MLNQYSNFWFDDKNSSLVDDFLGIDEKKKGKDLIALAGYRRAISNFVNIVTGKNIPVKFNMKDASYTDGKTITIGSNISDKNFDVAVGLALHEASHNLLTSFEILRDLESKISIDTMALAEGKGYYRLEIISHIKSLMNWVEDRRIDHFIFTTSPGYKGYYHSMYDKYFYSNVVDKALKSKKYRSETWESYESRIINIHNKNRQLNALNGLKDIWNIIDLKNINRLKSTEDSFDIACDIYRVVLNNIKDGIKMKNDETGEVTYIPSEGNEKSDGNGDSDGTPVDTGEGTLEFRTPYLATLRPGMFSHINPIPVDVIKEEKLRHLENDSRIKLIEKFYQDDVHGRKFLEADIVIGVGKGLGGPENLPVIFSAANKLGAVVAGTRNVTDAGWLPKQVQIGITGKAISPRVYLAIGIRGAFNHMVGLQNVGTLLAINKNRRHPIFSSVDVGVVGDWETYLDPMVDAISKIE